MSDGTAVKTHYNGRTQENSSGVLHHQSMTRSVTVGSITRGIEILKKSLLVLVQNLAVIQITIHIFFKRTKITSSFMVGWK